jgi:hypothetical protein
MHASYAHFLLSTANSYYLCCLQSPFSFLLDHSKESIISTPLAFNRFSDDQQHHQDEEARSLDLKDLINTESRFPQEQYGSGIKANESSIDVHNENKEISIIRSLSKEFSLTSSADIHQSPDEKQRNGKRNLLKDEGDGDDNLDLSHDFTISSIINHSPSTAARNQADPPQHSSSRALNHRRLSTSASSSATASSSIQKASHNPNPHRIPHPHHSSPASFSSSRSSVSSTMMIPPSEEDVIVLLQMEYCIKEAKKFQERIKCDSSSSAAISSSFLENDWQKRNLISELSDHLHSSGSQSQDSHSFHRNGHSHEPQSLNHRSKTQSFSTPKRRHSSTVSVSPDTTAVVENDNDTLHVVTPPSSSSPSPSIRDGMLASSTSTIDLSAKKPSISTSSLNQPLAALNTQWASFLQTVENKLQPLFKKLDLLEGNIDIIHR